MQSYKRVTKNGLNPSDIFLSLVVDLDLEGLEVIFGWFLLLMVTKR